MFLDSSPTSHHALPEVTVMIPTAKRPSVLTDTVNSVLSQSAPPRKVIIIANEPGDVETCVRDNPKVTLLFDRGSLTHKRNLALPYVEGKYVFFADDDIELHHAYLSEAVLLLEDFPGIVGLSGKVLKDGDVSRAKAKELIRTAREPDHWRGRFLVRGRYKQLYGCNMVLRRSVLERETFDDELPGYCFGEDYDFWVRVRRYGITGIYDRCIAVHLQAAGGRSSPAKVAYSRLANHWHFYQKGISHLPWPWSLVRIGFICVKFPLRSFAALMRGETGSAWQELCGYALAIADILRGRSRPSRTLEV
jgi:glycosyltransferase involved in cell wall biosynthesis